MDELIFTELLNVSMPFAMETLCRSGEFQPFGLCAHNNGEIQPYLALIGHKRTPRRKEIDQLYRNIRRLASMRQIKALCLCRQIPFRVSGESEFGCAIHCSFEHIAGDALDVILPFTFASDSMSFVFGTLIQKARKPSFFAAFRRGQTFADRKLEFGRIDQEGEPESDRFVDPSVFSGILRSHR